jgi:signal transduction histidine kinase
VRPAQHPDRRPGGSASARTAVETSLTTVPLFAGLASQDLRPIVAAGHTRTLAADRLVFREGDASDGLYVILDGSVRIYKRDDDGTEVDLHAVAAGGYFGELALIDGEPRSASVETLTPCDFFILKRQAFIGLLSQSPQLLATVLSNLSSAVRTTSERVFREMQQQQAIRTEMELARYRSLAEMVAGVAHEINTPLGTVNTAVSIVKGRLGGDLSASLGIDAKARAHIDDVHEAVELIEANVRRAHKLILDFKKLSVGQISDTLEPLDLVAVVDEVVGLFKINAREAKLTMAIRNGLAPNERVWLGFRGCLTQVLLNLLGNVERYAYPDGAGGQVAIAISAENGPSSRPSFVVEVRDFGRGIAIEHLPKIFDPFFTTGRSKGGTGLGMAIVHNIVTMALKGSIAVQSGPGEGTTVTLRIPQQIPD